jgi:hypothetical protein
MISLTTDELNALDSDTQRLGIFFRMASTPIVRVWLGVGYIRPGINAFDATDEIYSGLGELIDVPALSQLINGVADRVTFHASGVSDEVIALTAAGSNVKGAAVAMGVAMFGSQWQQLGPPRWLFRGRADYVALQQQSGNKGEGGITRVVELSVGSLFTGRRRRGLSYMTDADQQERHPGDLFCERTALYSEADKNWPIFTPPSS